MKLLTNKGNMKSRKNAYSEIVPAVVVNVKFHQQEGADEKRALYVVVPWSKRLHRGQHFVDPLAEFHEICVVIRCVVYCQIQSLKSRLCTIVREVATVVGNEGLRCISARECLN